MGVTLFTLIYGLLAWFHHFALTWIGENPFFDVEETIAGVIHPPFDASSLCVE